MRLSYIKVENLRCIEKIEINLRDFTSLIGPNNSGKSTVLRGLEILLNQTKPDPEEWCRGKEEQSIAIEACFEDVSTWERARPGVAGLIHDAKIRLRLTCSRDPNTQKIEMLYEALMPEETIDGWADKWADLDGEYRTLAGELGIQSAQFRSGASKEKIKEAIRTRMPQKVHRGDPKWTDDSVSINSALQQALPQAILVPAVSDAEEESKAGAKNPFGVMLTRVVIPAVKNSREYTNLMNAVDAIREKLCASGEGQLAEVKKLSEDISKRISSILDAKASLSLDAPDVEKLLVSNAGIRIDDGTQTPVQLQGHGVQRALVFALIEALAKQRSIDSGEGVANVAEAGRSTIFLFEEPELYLHPHLMRRLKKALKEIGKLPDWQVVISTHSPFLVDIADDPLSLVLFRRVSRERAPTVKQLKKDPFEVGEAGDRDRRALRAVLDFHPTVCEVFFAQRTVLVEGDSEVAVLSDRSRLCRLLGIDSKKADHCTVVSCGGKWTIPPIAQLLQKFDIPFRIIHDRDKKGRTAEELAALPAIHPYKANERIAKFVPPGGVLVVDDTLEDIIWDRVHDFSSDKPYRAWMGVNELCDARENLDHAPKFAEFVRFAFDWET